MIDFRRIKEAAAGRCGEIIDALTPLPADVVNKRSADHPCPLCCGQTVIWPDDRDGGADRHGRIACRNCTDNKPTGDIVATVKAFGGFGTQGDAAKAILSYVGIAPESNEKPQPIDIVDVVAKAKSLAAESLRAFGAAPASRRINGKTTPVARIPVYNTNGKPHSHFDMTPDSKGYFKKGRGNWGLLFPGRLPEPGETWCLAEGKDGIALYARGYNGCGLPGTTLPRLHANLFRDVDVVIVPDLDRNGQAGGAKSGGHLFGIARSIRVARLPGEVTDTKGDDVRDVIKRDGPESLDLAIEQARPWQPGSDPVDTRPVVLLTPMLADVCDEVTSHVGELGWSTPWIAQSNRESRKVYQRGGTLVDVIVEVRADATATGGGLRLQEARRESGRYRFSKCRCELLTRANW